MHISTDIFCQPHMFSENLLLARQAGFNSFSLSMAQECDSKRARCCQGVSCDKKLQMFLENLKEYFFRETNEFLLVLPFITISSNMHMTQQRDVFNSNRILGSSSKNYRMDSLSKETVMRTTSKENCRALKKSNTIVENILWYFLWNLLMAGRKHNRKDVEL